MPKYYDDETVAEAFSEMTNHSVLWAKAVLSTVKEADVAPVIHGHWRKIFKLSKGDLYECSRCKRLVTLDRGLSPTFLQTEYPYCNCGARMDEEVPER